MVGFGLVDCLVMTQVGSTLELMLGASLGISSITAAAIGLFCSDSCGVLFGGTIEAFAERVGLPTPQFVDDQHNHPSVSRCATGGRLIGVQLGVLLGSTSLLFYKDHRCTECSRSLTTGAKFCANCGAATAAQPLQA